MNKILMGTGKRLLRQPHRSKNDSEVLYKGTPAMCLNFGELLQKPRIEKERQVEEARTKDELEKQKERV